MVGSTVKFSISKKQFDGVIFDLDGVITQSAKVHAKAWKEMFDAYLKEQGQEPFDIGKDYNAYVDGKPRYEGVASFLASRNIDLPHGASEDAPEKETICGLGNRKNKLFLKYLKEDGVDVYKTSLHLVKSLLKANFKIGLVTSSKNCTEIIKSAGIHDLFDVQVDGITAEKRKLKGKPQPDIFLVAAEELGIKPEKAVVIEDAVSGVQAGVSGHFGCVIGVNRGKQKEELIKAGADFIVSDLSEIGVEE